MAAPSRRSPAPRVAGAPSSPPARLAVVSAFAAVYVIWGSTYLGILYAIRTIPVFLMAGSRFIIAGLVLVLVAALRGAPRPRLPEVRSSVIAGILLLMTGNGGVVWAETRVATGPAALVVASVPFWVVFFEWLGGRRPSGGTAAGLALGLAGIGVLLGPRALAGGGGVDLIGGGVLLLASASWAAGSIYTHHAVLPASPQLATGIEMVGGGAALLALSGATGEFRHLELARISAQSWWGWVYLIIFGSLVAFSAYIWLVRNVSLTLSSTYAFVNPVVAVLLGWAIAGEALTVRTAVAAGLIVTAVVLITMSHGDGVPSGE
jgi:drug/metabolite transporter (DMT)-like permease